jgi:hypothetical protein
MSYSYPSNIELSGEPFLVIKARKYASAFQEEAGSNDPGVESYKIIIPQNIQSDDNFTYEQTSVLGADAVANLSETFGYILSSGGQIVRGLSDSVANNASRFLGGSINPKEELLFKTPELRTHSFTFNMFARSEQEATVIAEIIKSLREKAYPTFYGVGTGSAFFAFPHQFEVYHGFGVDNAFPKIDAAFLTSISTNYAGSGRVSLTPDNYYQAIELTLTFQDIRIHTSEDINGVL